MSPGPTPWTLGRAWEAVRKSWLLILGLVVASAGVGYVASASQAPQYESAASLYFALNEGTSGADLNQGSTYTQNQMLSFARLATSSRVLEPVIEQLGLDTTPTDLAERISITIPQDTVILEVAASSSDAARAAEMANAVSVQLVAVVQEVASRGEEGVARITASVIDVAVPPAVQSSPNKTRDTALAGLLGLLLGLVAAFVLTVADTRVRNEAAVARVTDLPVLGSVARTRRGVDAGLVAARDPHGAVAEDVRRVLSALAFSALNGSSSRILVTSCSPGEGKSTFATNLAVVFADTGERTLIVDADLRRPRVHELFGLDGSVGLTTALVGDIRLSDAIVTWGERGPDVLVSGVLPPSPAAVITSEPFREALDAAAATYETVIIDSPPVLTVADSNLLAPLVDGVVIVVDSSKTRRPQLARTIRSLEAAGGRIIGIVLNKSRPRRGSDVYYRAMTEERVLER
ncbi:polysaccharide biosynthesis tyrosine autokinase [Agrococcus sp. HG114]|uniref:polysaccharide biosynthesis tyrosine autokinase n=1 Tax=Agrococcus sp. HG114 TaxID=2969757 RepID=UPI00215AAA24|nr:polysaccharide biosynthesis tyrosine autokinase [Agrococcus sp. HG114]MCR8670845.1 polysaccharide biosynthesis tyrosine autokinase [Agrococcus sp. HG114]